MGAAYPQLLSHAGYTARGRERPDAPPNLESESLSVIHRPDGAPETPVLIAGSLWVAAILATWIVQIFIAPMSTDAGLYVPHARMVLDGNVPYRDFASSYPPGIYYGLALWGHDLLRSPSALKLLVFATQTANGVLVYSILRRLGQRTGPALLLTGCFGGLVTAAWGMAFELEPFMNLGVLGALRILLAAPHPLRSAAAGACLGAALMVKQYALLALPGLLLACALPIAAAASEEPDSGKARVARTAALLALVPLPYAIFVGATGLGPVDTLVHLATFGGRGAGYGVSGLAHLLDAAANGRVGRFLLPTALFAGWLLLRAPSRRTFVLVLGLVGSAAPLYTRTFDYYFQTSIPWALFVTSAFIEVVGQRFRESRRAAVLVTVLVSIPPLGITVGALREALAPSTTIHEQLALARALESEIEGTEDVLVLNGSWLYVLTHFVPPLDDYTFNLDPRADQERRSRTRFAVLLAGSGPVASVRAWLGEDGLRVLRRISWEGRVVEVLGREEP